MESSHHHKISIRSHKAAAKVCRSSDQLGGTIFIRTPLSPPPPPPHLDPLYWPGWMLGVGEGGGVGAEVNLLGLSFAFNYYSLIILVIIILVVLPCDDCSGLHSS